MAGQFDGAKLRTIREEAGWSRAQLAVEVVRSEQTIGLWERGRKSPPPEVIFVIAQALGVKPRDLMSTPRKRVAA
jgi:transcriptional regulator with XRE-family HTH domain